jgi:hypothetical protein
MKRRNWLGAVAALVLAVGAVGPRGAGALTLADLDAGGSFSAGSLTFEDFDIVIAGDLPVDLTSYAVQVLADGFRISGPISAILGGSGTLLVSYEVSALSPIISGASLLAAGATVGAGAQALVVESLLGPASEVLGTLFVFDVEGVGADPDDTTGFTPVSSVSVVKSVIVGGGMVAAMPVLEQRFLAVGEPLTVVLLAGGLAGLAIAGRRRDVPV